MKEHVPISACPFCQSDRVSIKIEYNSNEKITNACVICNFCKAQGPLESMTNEEAAIYCAIDRWNIMP